MKTQRILEEMVSVPALRKPPRPDPRCTLATCHGNEKALVLNR